MPFAKVLLCENADSVLFCGHEPTWYESSHSWPGSSLVVILLGSEASAAASSARPLLYAPAPHRSGPRALHVVRKLLILLIIIITGTAKFSLTAPFQKRIIKNYNYWNCTLSWPRSVLCCSLARHTNSYGCCVWIRKIRERDLTYQKL